MEWIESILTCHNIYHSLSFRKTPPWKRHDWLSLLRPVDERPSTRPARSRAAVDMWDGMGFPILRVRQDGRLPSRFFRATTRLIPSAVVLLT